MHVGGLPAVHDVGDQAEVEQDQPTFLGDHDVGGLDVAVDLSRVVQRHEAAGELAQATPQPRLVVHGRFAAPAVAYVGGQVDALYELHGEEPVPLLAGELSQADQVAVVQVLERVELALEPQQSLRGQRAEGLEGHALVALAVDGLVDHAHSAGADPTEHAETVRTGEVLHGLAGRSS
jgi:hypothetical protein